MAARLFPLVLLLLTGLNAQDVKPKPQTGPKPSSTSKPAKTVAPQKASAADLAKEKQDPGPTPQERQKALQARLAKLRSELKEIQDLEKEGGIVNLIQSKLGERSLKSRSIVDKNEPRRPQPKPPAPAGNQLETGGMGGTDAQPQVNKATVITGDMLADLPKGTIMMVNGLAATQSEYDALIKYYKSYPQSMTEKQLRSKAVEALILIKSAQTRFPEGTRKARARLREIEKELGAGKDFAELAKSKSDCPSKAQGGSLGLFSRHQMDPNFTRHSFTTKVGSTTAIFPSAFGFHIVKVDSYERGDTPAEDKVRASHILALYDIDSNKVKQCMTDAMSGKSKIQFVKQDMIQYAPRAYQ